MKLKIKEFETLARQNGYRNGKALMKKLGAGKCAYGCLKRGCKIGYDLVKAIHNEFDREWSTVRQGGELPKT